MGHWTPHQNQIYMSSYLIDYNNIYTICLTQIICLIDRLTLIQWEEIKVAASDWIIMRMYLCWWFISRSLILLIRILYSMLNLICFLLTPQKFFALPSWNSKKKPIYRGAVHLYEPHRPDIKLIKQSINWMWNHYYRRCQRQYNSIQYYHKVWCNLFVLWILPEIMPICILLETRGVKWLEI